MNNDDLLVHIHMRWHRDTIASMDDLGKVVKDMDNPTDEEIHGIAHKMNELYTNGLLDDLVDEFYNRVEERVIESMVTERTPLSMMTRVFS